MLSFRQRLLDVQGAARQIVDRHTNPGQKKASLALYGVLADCLALVEACDRDPLVEEEMRAMFAAQPKEGNRRYVEKGSDSYIYVCRFVFTSTDRTNAMRYAAALREAHKLQVRSMDLVAWMKQNGGVNALYFRRPLEAREVRLKALRLSRQITVSRHAPFSLTLRWKDDNSFEVIHGPEA